MKIIKQYGYLVIVFQIVIDWNILILYFEYDTNHLNFNGNLLMSISLLETIN